MEPPLKRRRVSLDDPDEQLHYRRTLNDSRLKASFESIFEKYGKDFSEVGDEIDLETGEIVVNNGHLLSMRNEQDIDGEGNEVDELYGLDGTSRNREAAVSDAGDLDTMPELMEPSLVYDHDQRDITDEDVDSLMGDIGYLDHALVTANPYGVTDGDILGFPNRNIPPSGTRTEQYPNLEGSQSDVKQRSANQQGVCLDSRDLATDPKWIIPPLPDLRTTPTPQPSQDQLQILRDYTQRPASPPGDSLWATPEMPTLHKHRRRKWLKTEDALLRHLKLSTNLTYREMQPQFPGRAWNALRKRWMCISPVKEPSVHRSKDEDDIMRLTRSSTSPSVSEVMEKRPGRTSLKIKHRQSDIQSPMNENENSNIDRVYPKTSKEEHLIQPQITHQTTESPRAIDADLSQSFLEASSALPTPLSPPGEALFRHNQPSATEVQGLPAEVQLSSVEVHSLATIDEHSRAPLTVSKTAEPLAKNPIPHLGAHSRMLSVVVERSNHSPTTIETVSPAKSNLQSSQLQSPPESAEDRNSSTSPCSQDRTRRNFSHLDPSVTSDGPCIFPPLFPAVLPTNSYAIEQRRDSSDSVQIRPYTLLRELSRSAGESTSVPKESSPLLRESTPLSRESTPMLKESTPVPKESILLPPPPDSYAKDFWGVSTSTNPETPPIVEDEYQDRSPAQAALSLNRHCSTPIPVLLPLQANASPPEVLENPHSLDSEGVPSLLESSRDDLDFISILSTPARPTGKTAGSSTLSNTTPRKRKKRSSSIAVTSFGSMLGDLSDDELSLPLVTYPRIPSVEKAKVSSLNRRCGSAGFKCDRKVCLRCT